VVVAVEVVVEAAEELEEAVVSELDTETHNHTHKLSSSLRMYQQYSVFKCFKFHDREIIVYILKLFTHIFCHAT
jgi:hypothetical protein